MRHFAILGLITTTALAGASTARADEPAPQPAFFLMDNTGDGAGVDLSFPIGIGTTQSDGANALIRPRLAIQDFVGHVGGYAILQATSQLGGGDSESGLGNLEVGALYHTALSPHFDLGARVGAALATASGGAPEFINLLTTFVIRPADLATSLPGNWIRLGVSPTYHDGVAFARVDAGVDVPVTSRDEVDGATLVHVNVGAGVAAGKLIATAELSTLLQQGARDQFLLDGDTLYTGGASVRYDGPVSPYLGVSTPLGNGETAKVVTVTLGLTVRR